MESSLSARIDSVRMELTQRIEGVRTELDAEIDGVRAELSGKIDGLRTELSDTMVKQFRWVVGLQITVLVTLVGALLLR